MRADQHDLETPRRWGELVVDNARTLAQRCGGDCHAPHWGYVICGSIRVSYPDHDEVIGGGDAYYVAPAHTGIDLGDAELVGFSPQG